MKTEKPTHDIIIHVKGGIVQNVFTTTPKNVLVRDFDDEAADPEVNTELLSLLMENEPE